MTILRRYYGRPLIMVIVFSVIQYQIFGQQPTAQSTPVIGGPCKLGSADVNIGGKQTQFFLHCEADDSSNSDGIWVVKSRLNKGEQQSASTGQQTEQIPPPKKHAKLPNTPIICEQNLQAREGLLCNTPETCLQQNFIDPNSYLQCNPTTYKWTKKYCQPGFAFNFEHQSCIGHPKAFKQHVARQPANIGGNLICTYSQCSQSNPCASGTCNNGYCCSSSLPASAPMSIAGTIGHNSLKQLNNKTLNSANILMRADDWTIPIGSSLSQELSKLDTLLVKATGDGLYGPFTASCAAGFTSNLRCTSLGQCPPGLFCDVQVKLCCPLLLPLSEVSVDPPVTRLPSSVRPTYRHYTNNQLQRYPTRYSKISPGSRFAPMSSQPPAEEEDFTNGIARNFKEQRRPMHQFPCPRCNQLFSYACPNGARPYGSCSGGSCATGYQCIPATNLCCPTTPQPLAYSGCPGGGASGGSCIGGQCGSGFACNSNNVCCAQVVPATVCPDGTQAAGACVNNMCGTGFLCNQGLCCTNTSQTPRCLDGSQAIGACMQGKCGTGYTCTTGNVCCPSTLNSCPDGQTSIGQCVNGRCPDGYTCINNQCCGPALNTAAGQVTCDRIDSNGPCIAPGNTCPEPGYACDTVNNWCCPQIMGNAVGPCIAGAGGTRLCPEGYACSGPGVGNCYRLNTGTCAPEDQFGPCGANNTCPPGFTCIGGFCCRDGSTKRRKRSFLEYI